MAESTKPAAPAKPRPPPFPLDVLKNCIHRSVCVELKNGECYNGLVKQIDIAWMNIHLVDVTRTSADTTKFWSATEALIRGSTIKSILFEPEAMEGPKKLTGRGARVKKGQQKGAPSAADILAGKVQPAGGGAKGDKKKERDGKGRHDGNDKRKGGKGGKGGKKDDRPNRKRPREE